MKDSRPAHEQVKNGNVVRFIKDYWFIIVAILGMAMSWASFKAELEANKIIDEKQEDRIQVQATSLQALDRKYIEDVTYIKTTLEELKKR